MVWRPAPAALMLTEASRLNKVTQNYCICLLLMQPFFFSASIDVLNHEIKF